MTRYVFILLLMLGSWTPLSIAAEQQTTTQKSVTFIQIGDIHDHLVPRPNLREGGPGGTEGGLARMYSVIQAIRSDKPHSVLVNTRDTVQGSAEALYTRGQALIDVLNAFDIDFFAPGNWDYLYGTERFIESFAGVKPLAPWNALAANLTYSGKPYASKTGETVLPAYKVTVINGIKIGIIGFTSERGPTVVGPDVAKGFHFTRDNDELAALLPVLKNDERVDLVVMISELGLANNIHLAETHPGVDIVLSSDMHEETREPVVTSTNTMIVEMGQDGTRVGELTVSFKQKHEVVERQFRMHRVDDAVTPDTRIAKLVESVRKPFVGTTFEAHTNPINGTAFTIPIDTVIGETKVNLHSSNFSNAKLPAVIEGSSHDFIADAFRAEANTDLGFLRGFRYGTHVAVGPIKLEDIYHYIPVGPFVAKGRITGQQILENLERIANGSLSPDTEQWTGGWLHTWSGPAYDLDPYAANGNRVSNVKIFNRTTETWEPIDAQGTYSVAGYNYATEPRSINKLPARQVTLLKENRRPLDATMVVANHLKKAQANPPTGRVTLLNPLPKPIYQNQEIQPLRGAVNME